jgi:hypothetical protein
MIKCYLALRKRVRFRCKIGNKNETRNTGNDYRRNTGDMEGSRSTAFVILSEAKLTSKQLCVATFCLWCDGDGPQR